MQIDSDLRPLHRRALDAATGLIDGIHPADLARSTPCAGWDLRALMGHMVGQNHGFAAAVTAAASGGDAPRSAYADRPPTDEEADAAKGWAASAAALTDAFTAADLGTPVLLVELSEEQRMPVGLVAGIHLLDTAVHTWDLATALGLPFRPDDDQVAFIAGMAGQIPADEESRKPGSAFAPPATPTGDDPWLVALAQLGR